MGVIGRGCPHSMQNLALSSTLAPRRGMFSGEIKWSVLLPSQGSNFPFRCNDLL